MKPLVFLLWLSVLTGCEPRASRLPVLGQVPDFELTDSTGRPFFGSSLRGKVWVEDFLFTTCLGPCPRMTSRLHQIQEDTRRIPGVEIVSMTVDPARDTPAVLADYSKEHAADTSRWHFLTGPQPKLHHLCRNVFLLGDVDGSLEHSTKYVLIDKKMRIRGYYDSFDPDEIQKLVSDIKDLARERA